MASNSNHQNLEINSKNDVKCKISEEVMKIKVEYENPENDMKSNFETEIKPKIEVKEEDFGNIVQRGMNILENLQCKSETKVHEKNLNSDIKTEIKPKIEVKNEDFGTVVQRGMEILENLQNKSDATVHEKTKLPVPPPSDDKKDRLQVLLLTLYQRMIIVPVSFTRSKDVARK